MPRYIDVERIPNDSFWEGMTLKEKAKVLQWFLQTPTADMVKVKRGEWIEQHIVANLGEVRDCEFTRYLRDCEFTRYLRDCEFTRYQCSNCNNCSLTTSPWCPNCGARMSPVVKK